jgi:hypothetical protein
MRWRWWWSWYCGLQEKIGRDSGVKRREIK